VCPDAKRAEHTVSGYLFLVRTVTRQQKAFADRGVMSAIAIIIG
jgi:hypothetical protein